MEFVYYKGFVQQPGYKSVHIVNLSNKEILKSVECNGNEFDLEIMLPLITDFFDKVKSNSMEIPIEIEMSFPKIDLYAKLLSNKSHSDHRLIIITMWPNKISFRYDVMILLKRLEKI